MPIQRYKPEQIVTMLRQTEVGIANGKTTLQACEEGPSLIVGHLSAVAGTVCFASHWARSMPLISSQSTQ